MIGLAQMIHALAVQRVGYDGMRSAGVTCCGYYADDWFESTKGERDLWADAEHLSSTLGEYYAIVQRLEQGRKP